MTEAALFIAVVILSLLDVLLTHRLERTREELDHQERQRQEADAWAQRIQDRADRERRELLQSNLALALENEDLRVQSAARNIMVINGLSTIPRRITRDNVPFSRN